MRLIYSLPIISTSIWGVAVVGGKILSSAGYSAVEITFGRFALASLIFIPILIYGLSKKNGAFMPRNKGTWLNIFGLSITGVAVNNSIFYYGLSLTNASIASLLVAFNPLMTMLFGVLLLQENMTRSKYFSVLLGIAGVVLIVGYSGNNGSLVGNLIILAAVMMWGSSFSFSKRASNEGLSSIAITAWSEILGTIMLLPIVLYNGSLSKYNTTDSQVILWFVFLGVISSVIAYILHYKAIEVLGSGVVAPAINIIPFSGALTAWLLLGEDLGITAFIGLFLILTGVIIVTRESQ